MKSRNQKQKKKQNENLIKINSNNEIIKMGRITLDEYMTNTSNVSALTCIWSVHTTGFTKSRHFFFRFDSSSLKLHNIKTFWGRRRRLFLFIRRKLKQSTFYLILHIESFRLRYTLSIKLFMLDDQILLWIFIKSR